MLVLCLVRLIFSNPIRGNYWIYVETTIRALRRLAKTANIHWGKGQIPGFTVATAASVVTITGSNGSTKPGKDNSILKEVYDSSVYLNDLKMIKAMANAEKAIVRCTGLGLYEEDIVLSKRHKQALLKVLRAYKNAGGVNEIYGNEPRVLLRGLFVCFWDIIF